MPKEMMTSRGKVEVLWEPPPIQMQKDDPKDFKKTRVAAYCRVSTDLDEQTESFELQERHYTRLIMNTPGWRLAGIYVDQGITGTQRIQRIGFQRMIRHCEEGKIDRIVCKSISRFARNTMDFLETVRMLKELNISVVFEKEGIDTLSVQSEFLLSTIAAIAQEESRSISENMGWAFKQRFQSGIPVFKRILGYDIQGKGCEKEILINEKEAAIVREIYRLALEGMGFTAIARIMMKKGYQTVSRKNEWTLDSVKGILVNERYTGDVLCQKTYTADYLTHKCLRNKGEKQQYLIENHHPAIIDYETFEAVQRMISKNKTGKTIMKNVYPLSGKITCGNCGATYHRYSSECYPSWRCSKSLKDSNRCSTRRIREETLQKVLLKAFDKRYDFANESVLHKLKLDIKRLQDNDNIERSRVILKRELAEVLSQELHSKDEARTTAIEKRMEIEEKLKIQEQYWSLIEKDRSYRAKALKRLDNLSRGENRMRIFLEQFDIEYMRAWVIGITILSPISFSIRWFDDTQDTVTINDDGGKR